MIAATSTSDLADRAPVRGALLDDETIAALMRAVPHWQVVRVDGKPRLTTSLPFRDFSTALSFAHRVGALANEIDHHPDLHVSWGHLGIDVWTHSAGGLTELDFIFAARVDRLAPEATGLLPESGR